MIEVYPQFRKAPYELSMMVKKTTNGWLED
jgi:hypothetical protein